MTPYSTRDICICKAAHWLGVWEAPVRLSTWYYLEGATGGDYIGGVAEGIPGERSPLRVTYARDPSHTAILRLRDWILAGVRCSAASPPIIYGPDAKYLSGAAKQKERRWQVSRNDQLLLTRYEGSILVSSSQRFRVFVTSQQRYFSRIQIALHKSTTIDKASTSG